jgi:RNA:NAD 2'-phosphotransferase (TPT1/KptA family)
MKKNHHKQREDSSELDSEHLSKKLSRLLRHRFRESINVYKYLDAYPDLDKWFDNGWVPVDLCCKCVPSLNADIIQYIVFNDKKHRYDLCVMDDVQCVRANQGHTVLVPGLELKEITLDDIDSYPLIIHGTYKRCMPAIEKTGLSKMARTHVHFAIGRPGDGNVISGAKSNVEVLIHLDLAKALNAGYKFYISSNNVILCEGDKQGYVPYEFFKQIEMLG